MTRTELIGERGTAPDLDPRAEFALLLRVLHREGFDDHIAGHVTAAQPDGTLFVNPFELGWNEVRASDVVVMDQTGKQLDGGHSINPAVELHLAVRRRRPAVGVVVHNHPRWSGLWAAACRVPDIFDQTSAQVAAPLVLVDEYEGSVHDEDESTRAATAFGDAEWALLAHHGVLITGDNVAHTYLRAITLEWRARRAWEIESLRSSKGPLDADIAHRFGSRFERGAADSWWSAARRQELDRDPLVLS